MPVIISNTLEDAALRLTNFDLTEEGLRTMMNQRYGAKAEEMLAIYRNRYPDKSPFLIQAQICTDSTARRSAMLQAERKAAQGKAPAYHVSVGVRRAPVSAASSARCTAPTFRPRSIIIATAWAAPVRSRSAPYGRASPTPG